MNSTKETTRTLHLQRKKHAGQYSTRKHRTNRKNGTRKYHGGSLEQGITEERQGPFELVLSSGAKIIGKVGMLVINAGLGMAKLQLGPRVPGSTVLGKHDQQFDFKAVLKPAFQALKIPLQAADPIIGQYLTILAQGFDKIGAPLILKGLKLTIAILTKQLQLAKLAISDPNFIAAFENVIRKLSIVAVELVGAIEEPLMNIIDRLSPILAEGAERITRAVAGIAVSSASAVPYAGTAVAALRVFDRWCRMILAMLYAGYSTGELFFDNQTETAKRLQQAKLRVMDKFSQMKSPTMPGMPAAPSMPTADSLTSSAANKAASSSKAAAKSKAKKRGGAQRVHHAHSVGDSPHSHSHGPVRIVAFNQLTG